MLIVKYFRVKIEVEDIVCLNWTILLWDETEAILHCKHKDLLFDGWCKTTEWHSFHHTSQPRTIDLYNCVCLCLKYEIYLASSSNTWDSRFTIKIKNWKILEYKICYVWEERLMSWNVNWHYCCDDSLWSKSWQPVCDGQFFLCWGCWLGRARGELRADNKVINIVDHCTAVMIVMIDAVIRSESGSELEAVTIRFIQSSLSTIKG